MLVKAFTQLLLFSSLVSVFVSFVCCDTLRRVCSAQNSRIQLVRNQTDFHTTYTFKNDEHTAAMLTWGGTDGEIIIVVTSESSPYLPFLSSSGKTESSVYTSTDGGKTFTDITSKFGAKKVAVQDPNGLQRNPADPNHIILLLEEVGKTILWVSFNGGLEWKTSSSTLKFNLAYNQMLKFYPHATKLVTDGVKRWMMVRGTDFNLYVSLDGGISWSKVASNVLEAEWGTNIDAPSYVYVLTDDTGAPFSEEKRSNKDCCSLRRVEVTTGSSRLLLTDVFNFKIYDSYVFASVRAQSDDRRNLKVSSNTGSSFQTVQLPTATPDTFYSVLAVEANQTIIHVDEPGATGKGVLYVSDSRGVIYSESLREHFFPDYLAFSDFVPVKSMRGTYLTTVIQSDSTMYSVITFDRGATWQRLKKPVDVECASGINASECSLQVVSSFAIRNYFSRVPGSMPLSSETARGIMLVHGFTSNIISTDDPDVYLSTDGGYHWKRVLIGPHHYQIAHFGALLVATPIAKPLTGVNPNVLHFSVDGGSCWHNFTFESANYTLTGITTAPGNRQLSVLLWGYTVDRNWRVHVVDFGALLDKSCAEDDYEFWVPHSGSDSGADGCLLGSRDMYKRLRADAWCAADQSTDLMVNSTVCPCTESDYDCAYGYYRPTTQSMDCVKHPNISVMEVCLNGDLKDVISSGYVKIPGDVCVGGYQPHFLDEQLIDLKRRCDENDKLLRRLTFDSDGHPFLDSPLKAARGDEIDAIQHYRDNQNHSVLITVIIIVGVGLAVVLGLIVLKLRRLRRHSRRSYRYSLLPDDEDLVNTRLLPSGSTSDDQDRDQDQDEPLMNIENNATVSQVADDEDFINPQSAVFQHSGAPRISA